MPTTTEPEVAPIVTQGQVAALATKLNISRKMETGQLARLHLQWWAPLAIQFAYEQKMFERHRRPTTSRDLKKVNALIGTMRTLEKRLTSEEDREVISRVLQLQERLRVPTDVADRKGQSEERYPSIDNKLRVILDGIGEIRADLQDVACNLPVIASIGTTPGNRAKPWMHELACTCLGFHEQVLAPLKLKPRVTKEAFVREMIALARTLLNDDPAKDGSAGYLKTAQKARNQSAK